MEVKEGFKIKVEYEGRYTDGEVFDSTAKHNNEPLEFVAGSNMLVKGFEEAVIGMKVGEEKEVTLEPKDAYGEHNPQYVQKFPKANFPKEAEVGMSIGIPTQYGQIPAKITEIEEETVTVDMNPPMAGKTLIFKIKVVDIQEGDFLKEMQNGHDCCCSGECSSEPDSCCKKE